MVLVAILKDRFVHSVAKLVVLLVHGEIAATYVVPFLAHDLPEQLVLDDRGPEGFDHLPFQPSPNNGCGICRKFDLFANDAFGDVLPDFTTTPAAHHALRMRVFEMHLNKAVVEDHIAIDEDEIIAGGQLGGAVEDDSPVEASILMPNSANV